MDHNIILIALLAAPVVVLMLLRVNASLVFLSLCLGSVLVQFVGTDATTVAASLSAQDHGVPSSQVFVSLFLLLLPVVLTTIIMIRSVRGSLRLAYNLLPAAGVGALLALLAVPLLSAALTSSITSLPLWHELDDLQTLIISSTALLALLSLWMQRPKHVSEGKES